MPDGFRHFRTECDDRGIETITLDLRDAPVNVFNAEFAAELAEIVARLERDPPRLAVFRSGKASGFLAGADVREIQRLSTEAQARAVVVAGQDLFDRVERLPFHTLAVIHGPCLGGGLEFALACRYRIARDDASTRLGFPEVQLGLIPGWGGTQRLPRLIGLRRAIGMILEASTLSAGKAEKAGLVDRAISTESFDQESKRFIEDRLAGHPVQHRSRGLRAIFLDRTRPGRSIVFGTARKRIRSREDVYPALPAALRAIEAGYRQSRANGLAVERDEFAHLVFTPTARNLIELFFQRERARKTSTWVGDDIRPRKVERAAVIGAGTMGAGIAQLLVVNDINVVLKEINDDLARAGMKRIEALTHEAVRKAALTREKADAAIRAIIPSSDWQPLVGADVAIEAVVEREDVKRDVFRQLAERLGPLAVLASNTSALSINRLAESTPNPDRVAGLHFFNPVHKMHLVEVVRAQTTNDATIALLVELVRKLGKTPVVVADSPGFLVNRILFPYLDEAVRLTIENGRGQEVDAEAVRFGMPMGPLELLDQVGIDIAADVSRTIAVLSVDSSPTPERFAEMVKDGSLGKKAGRGFYDYGKQQDKGLPTRWAYPRDSEPTLRKATPPGELSDTQKRLFYPMINEAAKCLEGDVVSQAWVIDLAMVLGAGFAPFRGGPLRMANSLGLDRVVRELEDLRRTHGPRFEPAALLRAKAVEGKGF